MRTITKSPGGGLLPFVLTFMLVLINKQELIGRIPKRALGEYRGGGTSVAMVILTVLMIGTV